MTETKMWNKFIQKNPSFKNRNYDAWCFGGEDWSADNLAKLVLENTKTATTSAYELYELDSSPLPPVGGINIILDSKEEAVCITETTKVYVCPYKEVSENHAFKEGEGNRSLEYWKRVHQEFFTIEMEKYNKAFNENMLVVCEEFRVIFK